MKDESALSMIQNFYSTLPPLMPRQAKAWIRELVTIQAAQVCALRGGSFISGDDILCGLLRSNNKPAQNLSLARMNLDPDQFSHCRTLLDRLDHSSLDLVLDHLDALARTCGASWNRQAMERSLGCFSAAVEKHTIYIKTTNKASAKKELFVRCGQTGVVFDFLELARKGGLCDLEATPQGRLCRRLWKLPGMSGDMADLNAEGGIQKLYAFYVHKPVPVRKICRLEGVPDSVRAHRRVLHSLGYRRFNISGTDLVNQTLNLYFSTRRPEDLGAGRVLATLGALELPVPNHDLLPWLGRAFSVYFTFSPQDDRIIRAAFACIIDGDEPKLMSLLPEDVRQFITQARNLGGIRRRIILGVAVTRNGWFFKPEVDYKNQVCLPGFSKVPGLYPHN